MWWLYRNPEGPESDLRTKIGQNGISSGVGLQYLKLLLCYLPEGRKLLLNTRNNTGGLAIARHKFPDLWRSIVSECKNMSEDDRGEPVDNLSVLSCHRGCSIPPSYRLQH